MPDDDADLPRPAEGTDGPGDRTADRRRGPSPSGRPPSGRPPAGRSPGSKGPRREDGRAKGPRRDDRRGGKGSRDDRRDDRRGAKGSRDDRRGGKGSRGDRRGAKGSRDDRRDDRQGAKGSSSDRRGAKGSSDRGGRGSQDRSGRSEPSRGREDAERRRQERAAPPDRTPVAPLPPGAPGFADPTTEIWIDEGPVRDEAAAAVRRGARRPRRAEPGPGEPRSTDVGAALVRAVGADRARRLERRLGEASEAFADERYQDAASILRPIAREAPGVPEVRELLGLSLYRLGRWKQAAEELEAFRSMTGSTEQHPVLADCYRARRQYAAVDELWEELRAVSPSAPLVAEGRIVAAGALADQGRLPEAIALLRSGWRLPGRAQDHHLRRAYALADLEERAGDVPRARELFSWVAATEPGFADVRRRLDALG